MTCEITESAERKTLRSAEYNYDFNKSTGYFARWGKTYEDDPDLSLFGPEIADIEVTTSCSGPAGKVCSFCYKSNTPKGENMPLETFKTIFGKMPRTLTQIAFGADATATANPDLFPIMEYCREHQIVPNITVANVTEETAKKLAQVCGAVAVSRYSDKNWCYDTVERLVRAGLDQVNIHQMLSQETYAQALETIEDYHNDLRLKGMKAIVFLSLKQKGRGKQFNQLTKAQFKTLVDKAFSLNVPTGFDSCSANKFIGAVKHRPNYADLYRCVEPCESSCFSIYVDVKGRYFPCSFAEEKDFGVAGDWTQGINLTEVEDFTGEVWNHPLTKQFRNALLNNKDTNGLRKCPLYDI